MMLIKQRAPNPAHTSAVELLLPQRILHKDWTWPSLTRSLERSFPRVVSAKWNGIDATVRQRGREDSSDFIYEKIQWLCPGDFCPF